MEYLVLKLHILNESNKFEIIKKYVLIYNTEVMFLMYILLKNTNNVLGISKDSC